MKTKAYYFACTGLSQTHLVYTSYATELVLCGYYTLSTKWIKIKRNAMPNRRMATRFNNCGKYDEALDEYTLTAPLIGQLGKNYLNGYDKLITGDELLAMALRSVRTAQYIIGGGKFVYLECEDIPQLKKFYTRNGFWEFNRRRLDRDETGINGIYLVQMIRYFNADEFPPDA
ncbi:MAG: N-acetyltransferase [Bacillota bacterium]|nr:N-acetyltransferase [Bacillota bacterium]